MNAGLPDLPDDVDALRALLVAERGRRIAAEANATAAQAKLSADQELIAHLKLQIEKMRREIFGPRSERTARLLDQMELQLEELEATASEDELAAERAAQKAGRTNVSAFTRQRPSRKPFPEHLPRERVVIEAPKNCPCCGGSRLSKLGEDITETLEVVPRQWKVIQTCAREVLLPRLRGHSPAAGAVPCDPERLGRTQPAGDDRCSRSSASISRSTARPSAMPGKALPLSLSTLADQVGACAASLRPIFERIEAHVFAAERLHGDDTIVPVLAKGKTDTGRIWTYVRDDQPFGGKDPPAAVFYYSRDRAGEHPQRHLAGYTGILQADAYGGYSKLYDARRAPGPVTEAACWVMRGASSSCWRTSNRDARRKAQGKKPAVISPMAFEAVQRIDALFEIERADQRPRRRAAQGRAPAAKRAAGRRARDLDARAARQTLAPQRRRQGHGLYAQALGTPSPAFWTMGASASATTPPSEPCAASLLGESHGCSAGSDRGGERAAVMYSLIVTAKMNDVDPQAWLADVLARIADHPAQKLDDLLPWNWEPVKKLRPARPDPWRRSDNVPHQPRRHVDFPENQWTISPVKRSRPRQNSQTGHHSPS